MLSEWGLKEKGAKKDILSKITKTAGHSSVYYWIMYDSSIFIASIFYTQPFISLELSETNLFKG